jgi:hypothetical protein
VRFRQSQLRVWMACPLQAYFQEYANLPRKQGSKAMFGTCVHAALEYYNRTGDVDMAKKLFLEAWENPATIGQPEVEIWNKFTTYGGLRQRGIEILNTYHDRMKIEERTVIVAEHTFLVPFGQHELTGTADLVSVRKNHRGKQILALEDYKCLTPRTPVLMPDGSSKPAAEIELGDVVVGEKDGVLVPTRVQEVFDNGVRPCVEVVTYGGRSVAVTEDHPFLTPDGWVKAADLVPRRTATARDGSLVKVALGWEGTGSQVVLEEAWLLGALLGDGCLNPSGPSITNIDSEIIDRTREYVAGLGFELRQQDRLTWRVCNKTGRKSVAAWRHLHGLHGLARTKVVPATVVRSGHMAWVPFLAGYFCTDGSVRVKPSPVITWHSVNRPLLATCQQMLANIGVKARIEKVKAVTKEGFSYRLTVSDRWGVVRLANELMPWVVGQKRQRVIDVANMSSPPQPVLYGYDPVRAVTRLVAQPTIGLQVGVGTHVTGGLVTHNTVTKRPSVAELALNIQFTAYLYAMSQPEFWFGHPDDPRFPALPNAEWYWETLKDMPKRAIWVHLWDNCKELDAGDRDDEDFARLYRLCNEVQRAVELQVFVPHIGDACQLCDYAHDPCPQTPPSREYWENQRLEADENSWPG